MQCASLGKNVEKWKGRKYCYWWDVCASFLCERCVLWLGLTWTTPPYTFTKVFLCSDDPLSYGILFI
jgi:hypothetical protein